MTKRPDRGTFTFGVILAFSGRLTAVRRQIMIREAESSALEERMAKLEGLVEQMNQRLNHLEAEIAQLRREIQTDFRWLLGIMIGTWVTIMLTLLFKP